MTTVEVRESGGLFGVLAADGRSPEIPESADAYGWLIGSWEPDGKTWKLKGEFRAKRMRSET